MYPTGNLFIPVEHGRLEAILKVPRIMPPSGVALVLHPLPTAGGTMHNKVVFHAANALNEAQRVCLRINFRGVGQSTGSYDYGRGEVDDARAGLDYLQENYPTLPMTVCGFSFGANVGLQAGIADKRVKNLISIGTPIDKYDFDFLFACRKPILFIHGDADEFGDLNQLQALVREVEKKTQVQFVVIAGANHFFEGHLTELKSAIGTWIMEQDQERNNDL